MQKLSCQELELHWSLLIDSILFLLLFLVCYNMWSAGKPLAIDISVVSPTQSHLLLYNHTQTEKLCAAQWREEQKNTKYLEALHSQSILFIPMAVETFGGWGLESRPVFATLADRISVHTGQAKSYVANQLYQRLAITLQRQHACAMIARQPL